MIKFIEKQLKGTFNEGNNLEEFKSKKDKIAEGIIFYWGLQRLKKS